MNLRTILTGTLLAALVGAPAVAGADSAVAVQYVHVVCTTSSATGEANGPLASASADMGSTTYAEAWATATHAYAHAEGSGGSSASASTALLAAHCRIGGSCSDVASAAVRADGLEGGLAALSGVLGYSPSLGMPVFVGDLTTAAGTSAVTLAAPGGVLDLGDLHPVAASSGDMACVAPVDVFVGPNLGSGA